MKDDVPFTVDLEEPQQVDNSKAGKADALHSGAPDARSATTRENGAAEPLEGAEAISGEGEIPQPGGEPPTLTVTQLTRRIRGLLEESFAIVLVEGELSNVKAAASGHLYFNLKDSGAQIRCVMFRNAAAGLRFELEDGLQAVLRGRLSVYEVRGEYQIQVLTLEPKGAGALQLAFEQLKRKLEAEGLFDPARKRPLPFLPRGVGIVTSARGAAIQDMLNVLERRFPTLPVLIYPATVQGEQAPGEIVAGIAALNRLAEAQNIDVIIVGRGGGSVEDLWAFNSEAVARAIHDSPVPVISAVGHEVDFTIADFVADLRAPTPSAAAELVVPVREDLRAQVEERRGVLMSRLSWRLEQAGERWANLRARLTSPEAALAQQRGRLEELRSRISLAAGNRAERSLERLRQMSTRLLMARPDRFNEFRRGLLTELDGRLNTAALGGVERAGARLNRSMGLLDSLSPLVVMGRGYASVTTPEGEAVRSVRGLHPGDGLQVRLRDGKLTAEIKEVREED